MLPKLLVQYGYRFSDIEYVADCCPSGPVNTDWVVDVELCGQKARGIASKKHDAKQKAYGKLYRMLKKIVPLVPVTPLQRSRHHCCNEGGGSITLEEIYQTLGRMGRETRAKLTGELVMRGIK